MTVLPRRPRPRSAPKPAARDGFARRRRKGAALVAAALCLGGWCAGAAEVVHEERSLYQNVLVTRAANRLCLSFRTRAARRYQTCVNERQPKRMELPYTRMMMGALLVMPDPARVLVVGLGGGILPMALAELLPDATIDVVEVDAAVAAVAERFFGFQPGPKLRVTIQDARVFGRRAAASPQRYDLVLLDAFRAEYIPEHLMTREYLEETRALLSPRGVVAANTFRDSGLYDHESETYFRVFGPFINFTASFSMNRVIFASASPLPDDAAIRAAAKAWRKRLLPYGVAATSYPRRFSRERDWDRTKRPLTDQYHPANVLRRAR